MRIEEILYIGDVKVFDYPVIMKCYGLGSCIGLFVKDRLSGVTGGAHIFIPHQLQGDLDDKPYAAEEAIQTMLEKMRQRGSNLQTLRAKIVGGANLFGGLLNVGALNIQQVMLHLLNNRIFIAASDVGGSISRTVLFNTATDKLIVNGIEIQDGYNKPVDICQKVY